MSNREDGLLKLSAILIGVSAVLYLLLFLLFHRLGDIEFYTFLDIAFIPIEVLLVGLVLNRFIALREKRALIQKLNMVIGAFFSEVGRELIARLIGFDANVDRVREPLLVRSSWDDAAFVAAEAQLAEAKPAVDALNGDLDTLREFLLAKRSFLLGLLENPNLLEHDRFTELLWAITHLAEELSFRDDLRHLPPSDLAHLSLDMRRAYTSLLSQWLEYMRHLKHQYPYLFSLAIRLNPLDPEAHVEVTE